MTTVKENDSAEETVAIFTERRRAGRLRRLRPVLLVVLALALVGGSVYTVWFSPLLTARRTVVTGTSYVSPLQVREVAHVPDRTPLARISVQAVRERVAAMPAVRSVRVSRSWPHEIRISVTERRPVAVVEVAGRLRGLSSDGVLFRPYASRPAGLPEIKDEGDADTAALREVADVVGSLPPAVLSKVDHVSVATVDQIELTMRSGRLVEWGSAAESAEKAEVLQVLLARDSHEIDVSVPGRPTTR